MRSCIIILVWSSLYEYSSNGYVQCTLYTVHSKMPMIFMLDCGQKQPYHFQATSTIDAEFLCPTKPQSHPCCRIVYGSVRLLRGEQKQFDVVNAIYLLLHTQPPSNNAIAFISRLIALFISENPHITFILIIPNDFTTRSEECG